jgi:integrase
MVRVPKPKTLPDVLTIAGGRRLSDAVRKPHLPTSFWTAYPLGLRLQEGVHLQVGDIDSQRRLGPVHPGEGSKDRDVPLPAPTLTRLRRHGRTHRHPLWLLPAPSSRRRYADGVGPRGRSTVPDARARVVEGLKFRKAVSTHTLRHSSATHSLEAGVDLRLIRHDLGHNPLKTTRVDLHVTSLGQERARALIEGGMAE